MVSPGAGETKPGAPIVTGVTTENFNVSENGPVLAPSCARIRQKYVRSAASLSATCTDVRPLPPGVMPSLLNTMVEKPASAATSTR